MSASTKKVTTKGQAIHNEIDESHDDINSILEPLSVLVAILCKGFLELPLPFFEILEFDSPGAHKDNNNENNEQSYKNGDNLAEF